MYSKILSLFPVPPSKVTIRNGVSDENLSDLIGPFHLGGDVVLSCYVEGGKNFIKIS